MYTSVCVPREYGVYTFSNVELGGESALSAPEPKNDSATNISKLFVCTANVLFMCGSCSLCFMVKETNIHILCTHILVP